MRVASVGNVIFAASMIGLGLQGLVERDFALVWQPSPAHVPARELFVALSGMVSVGCGVGLLVRRAAASASRVLLVYLLLWLLLLRVPEIVRAPTMQEGWSGLGETAVIVAGAWVSYARFASEWDRQRVRFATGDGGRSVARRIYGFALIPFGVAHFAYVNETAALVPGWLPAHVALAYATGCAFVAAGIAIVIGTYARLAATLSTVQIGLFTLLVWVPVVAAAGPKTSFQWSETAISATLTAGAWVVAESYRRAPTSRADA